MVPIYMTAERRGIICQLLGCPPDGHRPERNPATGEMVEAHAIPTESMTRAQIAAYEADWARTHNLTVPSDDLPPDYEHRSGTGQGPADPERARRHAAALAYIAAYRGRWDFILSLRSDRRWGTKYMRLSDRQVEVLLNAKARDEARANAPRDPRQATVVATAATRLADRPNAPDFVRSILMQASAGPITEKQIAALERWSAEEDGSGVTDGMYRMPDGSIVKVQKAVHGSGNLYAKRLIIDGDHGTFVYEAGLVRRLRSGWRLTVEQAAEYGRLYGFCIVCGATLTDENSIARGIGPICAANMEG